MKWKGDGSLFDEKEYTPPTYGKIEKEAIMDTTLDMVNRLNEMSDKKPLAPKSLQSYREWLRPFVTFTVTYEFVINDADTCKNYLSSLIEKNRDLTYVLNVRLLLQKIFRFEPKLPKISKKLLRDDIRTNSERIMSDNRLNRILTYAKVNKSSESGNFDEISDYVLVMYCTGLRPSEVLLLTASNLQELELTGKTTVKGKGSKVRFVFSPNKPSNKIFYNSLRARANIFGPKSKIFQYSARHYRRLFRDLQKDTLLMDPPFQAPHSIRRAAARLIYNTNNKDLTVVKRFLGHSNIKTTELYLDVADDDLIKSLNKGHGDDDNDDAITDKILSTEN
jgi:site-specific recombinase XerD